MESLNSVLEGLQELGIYTCENILSKNQVDEINQQIQTYVAEGHEGIVYEKDSAKVRAIHGPHLYSSFFNELVKINQLVNLAEGHLQDAVYLHQFKINLKRAFEGERWPWHQDYIYWQENDFIESPRLINIAIALDDITMENAPLCVIQGSHKHGCLCERDISLSGNWEENVSAELPYQIKKDVLDTLTEESGVSYVTCKAGDVFLFDPLLVHASSSNHSPYHRSLMILTYNAVSNAPRKLSARPSFLSAVDHSPIVLEKDNV